MANSSGWNGIGRAAGALLAAAAAFAGAGTSAGIAQTNIVVGIVAHGPPQWPHYVADQMGWIKDYGLTLDMVTVGAGTAQQLAAGSIDVAHSGFPDFVRATNQGAPVKIVINDISVPPYGVYAKPGIKTIAGLKGKTISIGGPKDVTLIYIKPLIASAGLSATDVDFVYAKAAGDRFSALAAGAVDAAILNPPSSFRAADLGFVNLGEIETYTHDFPFTVWAANMDWAAKHKQALLDFTKAYMRGVRWLYDVKNREQAVDILVKYAKQSRRDGEDSYDYLFTKMHVYSTDGLLSDAAYRQMTGGLLELGDLSAPVPPMAKFFDDTFVKAAGRESQ
jgi:NitT/TauT family transport system substrate-binding protein